MLCIIQQVFFKVIVSQNETKKRNADHKKKDSLNWKILDQVWQESLFSDQTIKNSLTKKLVNNTPFITSLNVLGDFKIELIWAGYKILKKYPNCFEIT